MKRFAFGTFLLVASFAPLQATPHAQGSADAETFWTGRSEKKASPAEQPAGIAAPSVYEPQRRRPSRRAPLLLADLILCGVAAKRRLPQRALARLKRWSHRPSAAERGLGKVSELQLVAAALRETEVHHHLDAICRTSAEIFALLEQRPELSRNAGLIEFTLDQVLTIASSYRDIARTGLPAATPALARATSLLASIDGNLRSQFERLLEDDLTQLVSAVELLDARLEIEAE